MNAQIIRRQIGYHLRRAGGPLLAGVALLLAALVYAVLLVGAENRRSELIAGEIARAHAQLEVVATAPRPPPTPGEQLLAFYNEFPNGASVPDWLEKIYALAAAEQLTLTAGEYTLTKNASGRLDRYRITLPVKGTYPQLRKFIAAALASAPALALDSVYMKRDKVGDGAVDARIVFQLHLEKGA